MKSLFPIPALILPLLAALACSSSSASAPAPVISNFTMDTPVAAGATTVTGTMLATDASGLTDLTLKLTITGTGIDSTLSVPVEGNTAATSAMIPVTVELTTAIPAGTYTVSVTLEESGVDSNSLSTTVVVQ